MFVRQPPRQALSDITNLLSPLRPASLPRRTSSAPSSTLARPPTAPLDPLQRWGAVVLTQIGLSPKQAAPLVQCTPKAIRRWSEAFEDGDEVEDAHRCGRPTLLDENKVDAVVSAAIDNPKASTPRQLKHLFNLSCSPKTVRRVLDDAGLFGRIARVIPPMKPATIQRRIAFAEGYKNFDWTRVLWSDEMSIRLGPQGQTWVQRPIGECKPFGQRSANCNCLAC